MVVSIIKEPGLRTAEKKQPDAQTTPAVSSASPSQHAEKKPATQAGQPTHTPDIKNNFTAGEQPKKTVPLSQDAVKKEEADPKVKPSNMVSPTIPKKPENLKTEDAKKEPQAQKTVSSPGLENSSQAQQKRTAQEIIPGKVVAPSIQGGSLPALPHYTRIPFTAYTVERKTRAPSFNITEKLNKIMLWQSLQPQLHAFLPKHRLSGWGEPEALSLPSSSSSSRPVTEPSLLTTEPAKQTASESAPALAPQGPAGISGPAPQKTPSTPSMDKVLSEAFDYGPPKQGNEEKQEAKRETSDGFSSPLLMPRSSPEASSKRSAVFFPSRASKQEKAPSEGSSLKTMEAFSPTAGKAGTQSTEEKNQESPRRLLMDANPLAPLSRTAFSPKPSRQKPTPVPPKAKPEGRLKPPPPVPAGPLKARPSSLPPAASPTPAKPAIKKQAEPQKPSMEPQSAPAPRIKSQEPGIWNHPDTLLVFAMVLFSFLISILFLIAAMPETQVMPIPPVTGDAVSTATPASAPSSTTSATPSSPSPEPAPPPPPIPAPVTPQEPTLTPSLSDSDLFDALTTK